MSSVEVVPKDLRQLRACLVCSLIKTFDQFEFDGCDNCDEFLHMKSNKDNIYDCTSNNFDGMIALMFPEDSWVAKWQRISKYLLDFIFKNLRILNMVLFYSTEMQRCIRHISIRHPTEEFHPWDEDRWTDIPTKRHKQKTMMNVFFLR